MATAEKHCSSSPAKCLHGRTLLNSFTKHGRHRPLFRQSGNWLTYLVSSLLFIVGIVGKILVRNRRVWECTSRVLNVRDLQGGLSHNHCDQCQSVFLRSESIDPAKRQRKKTVEKYQSRIFIRKVMSPLPGLSDGYRSRRYRF